MENEKENVVPNDRRAIIIHSSSCWANEFEFNTKISIYYLPKNSYREEGYIIEAKMRIVRDSKIEYITKEYFDKIYKEFENINLKALKKEKFESCDGWSLRVDMGMIKCTNYDSLKFTRKTRHIDPLKFTGKIRHIYLLNPYEDRKKPEMSKLLKLIDAIYDKIKFHKWCDYNYKEWEKYSDVFYELRDMRVFRIGFDLEDDW